MASVQSLPDWRPPRGLWGLVGLRDDAPSEARGADAERAGRPRGDRRSGGARQRPEIWRGVDGERAGRPRGGRRSGGPTSNTGKQAGEWTHRYEKPATRRPPVVCASWGT